MAAGEEVDLEAGGLVAAASEAVKARRWQCLWACSCSCERTGGGQGHMGLTFRFANYCSTRLKCADELPALHTAA